MSQNWWIMIIWWTFWSFHKSVDLGRTRTCNPLIRSQMPYPLGHKTLCITIIALANSTVKTLQHSSQHLDLDIPKHLQHFFTNMRGEAVFLVFELQIWNTRIIRPWIKNSHILTTLRHTFFFFFNRQGEGLVQLNLFCLVKWNIEAKKYLPLGAFHLRQKSINFENTLLYVNTGSCVQWDLTEKKLWPLGGSNPWLSRY